MLMSGLDDSPSYFNGKSRSCIITIQGKFMKPIPMHHAKVGQCFDQQLLIQPPIWLLDILVPLINRLCPSMVLKLDGDHPFFLAPLMTSMQTINVSKDGNQPSISSSSSSSSLIEDLSLIGKEFINMSSSRRKQYLSNHDNLKKYTFDPTLVYTFEFYQHIFRFDSYKIKVGIIEIDINSFIGRNHINHMCIIIPNDDDDSKIVIDDIDKLSRVYDIEIIHSKCLTANTEKQTQGYFW